MPNQRPVRLEDIRDGTSQTLFFGERSRWDPNYDTFAAQGWDWEFHYYGNWCGASRLSLAHITLSGYSPINYRLPFDYEGRAGAIPSAGSQADFAYYIDMRVCAFGSSHPCGANVSRCDDQHEGVGAGWHRIILQDMSVSTGVVRQDHGTVAVEAAPPPPVRHSRLPPRYASPTQTPLRKEVKPERQTIDLDIS